MNKPAQPSKAKVTYHEIATENMLDVFPSYAPGMENKANMLVLGSIQIQPIHCLPRYPTSPSQTSQLNVMAPGLQTPRDCHFAELPLWAEGAGFHELPPHSLQACLGVKSPNNLPPALPERESTVCSDEALTSTQRQWWGPRSKTSCPAWQ